MRELNKLAIKLDFLQKQTIKSKSANGSLNDNLIVLLTMTNKVSGSMFAVGRFCVSVNFVFIDYRKVEFDHQRAQSSQP
jgi:5-bromo-4-chloroindolyl phosphate hydrolysis protein